jgi:hypothetical protein
MAFPCLAFANGTHIIIYDTLFGKLNRINKVLQCFRRKIEAMTMGTTPTTTNRARLVKTV